MKTALALFILIAPCAVLASDLEIASYLDDDVFAGKEYNKLFRIENLDYSRNNPGDINVTVRYNITINNTLVKDDWFFVEGVNKYKTAGTGFFMFNQSGNYTVCGEIISSSSQDERFDNNHACKTVYAIDTTTIECNVSIIAESDKELYNDSEKIKFHNILSNDTYYYTIEYWIEDLFGSMIKDPYNTSNQNQKSYTPRIDEVDRVYIIKNRIADIGCNNTSENTADERYVMIKGALEREELLKASTIEITNVKYEKGKSAKFGEKLDIELNIYKGDTLKKVIYLWIENSRGTDVSYKTKAYINDKHTNQKLTIPVQLKPDCNGKYEEKEYVLVVEGLGIEKSEKIMIQGVDKKMCEKTNADNNNENNKRTTNNNNNIDDENDKKTIKSFYTRSTKPKEDINIYASINNPENKILVFESGKKTEHYNLSKDNESIKINTPVGNGKNIFLLKVYEDNVLVDEKVMIKEFTTVKEKPKEDKTAMEENSVVTGRAIKSHIVYESGSRKSVRLLPYFMVCFMGLASLYFSMKKA